MPFRVWWFEVDLDLAEMLANAAPKLGLARQRGPSNIAHVAAVPANDNSGGVDYRSCSLWYPVPLFLDFCDGKLRHGRM